MLNSIKRARRRLRRYYQTRELKPCWDCGDPSTVVIREAPNYLVRCTHCGYESEPKRTLLGAIRAHEHTLRSGGGWNRFIRFECCGTEAEVRWNGPDPRRYLSGQEVIVECRLCHRTERATHLRAVNSFSMLNASRDSS